MYWQQLPSVIKRSVCGILLCLCVLCGYGCSNPNIDFSRNSLPSLDLDIDLPIIGDLNPSLKEVAPPELIQELRADLATAQPKVEILEPQAGKTLEEANLKVKLNVSGLKLFRDPDLQLGPHIALILDDQDPLEIYTLSQPIELKDLSPGSHTLRAIAAYPWHESFKNPSAYAQVGFNVLTSSRKNAVNTQPVLSASSIQSHYNAEPVLVDFVIREAKTNADTDKVTTSKAQNIQVKATINDQSFTIPESEASIYIEGLKEGTNWLKLELEDSKGQLTNTPFSEQTYQFSFDPDKTNSLSKLTTGDIDIKQAGVIVGRPKPLPPKATTPAKSETQAVNKISESSPAKQSETSTPKVTKELPSSGASQTTKSYPRKTEAKTVEAPKPRTAPATPEKSASQTPKLVRPRETTRQPATNQETVPEARPLPSAAARFPSAKTQEKPAVTSTNPDTEGKKQPRPDPQAHLKDSTSKESTNPPSKVSQSNRPTPSRQSTNNPKDLNKTKTESTSMDSQSKPLKSAAPTLEKIEPKTQAPLETKSKVDTDAQTSTTENLDTELQSFTEEAQDKINQSLNDWRDRFQKVREKATSQPENLEELKSKLKQSREKSESRGSTSPSA